MPARLELLSCRRRDTVEAEADLALARRSSRCRRLAVRDDF